MTPLPIVTGKFVMPPSTHDKNERGLTRNQKVACHRGMSSEDDIVFKALADASRRKILDRLRQRSGLTLSEICEAHDMTRQAVTKHVALLEAANLVVSVKRGRERLHSINPIPIHAIDARWIGKFEQGRIEALHDLNEALRENNHD